MPKHSLAPFGYLPVREPGMENLGWNRRGNVQNKSRAELIEWDGPGQIIMAKKRGPRGIDSRRDGQPMFGPSKYYLDVPSVEMPRFAASCHWLFLGANSLGPERLAVTS